MIRTPIHTSIKIKNNYLNICLSSTKKIFRKWSNKDNPRRPRIHKSTDIVYKSIIDPDNGKEYMKNMPWWKFNRVININKDSLVIKKWLK